MRLKCGLGSALAIRWMCGLLVSLAVSALAATPARASDVLSESQAQQDVRVLVRALKTLHPGLHKYNTPAQADAAFVRFEARGNAARTATELYLAASELATAIRCGHTMTNPLNQGGVVKRALLDTPNKLPFLLSFVESRALVIASARPDLAPGDEVLSINGTLVADIIKQMMPYLRADGASDGKRLIQLNHDRAGGSSMDLVWPLLSPPTEGRHSVSYRRSNGAEARLMVDAIALSERNSIIDKQGKGPRSEAWTLTIDNAVAVLTLPTFSFWREKFDWAAYLDESFVRMRREGVSHLIIDIRANEGGDGAINRAILSHLLRTAYTWPATRAMVAYERVPYVLVKYLDTWDYDFFDRTGRVEKSADGLRYVFTSSRKVDPTITPKPQPFAGKTYLLVGPENSSATFQLALLAQQSAAATLIGQTTGGNLRGLNGGELTWVTLPNSGVSVDIPLISSEPITPQPDASVTPDVVVPRSFAARAAGQDLEMDAALRLIANDRKR
jgi:C-terminal processing protease CtpA/Prc